ncbi:MAG: VOC family protein [Fuerstiella sp.]|nr:VOC family protein [Fuerstiella sp.]
MSGSIRVQHIDHVTIVVKDLKRSREFYVDLLGMEEVDRPNFSFSGAWFRAGATLLHLIEEHAESGVAGTSVDRSRNSRCHHFAFEVADARAAAGVLRDRGVSLLQEVKLRPDGAVQMFVGDPDGHVVELCTSTMSKL